MSQPASIPVMPASQEDSSLANLWRNALQFQPERKDGPVPKTFLSPGHMYIINLVPMDSPNPLYHSDYVDLRNEFLLDYMIQDSVLPNDPRFTGPGGFKSTNLNGKSLTFTKDEQGTIHIEGLPVTEVTEKDGEVTYSLDGLLLDHRERVTEAWKDVVKRGPRYDAFGGRLPPLDL